MVTWQSLPRSLTGILCSEWIFESMPVFFSQFSLFSFKPCIKPYVNASIILTNYVKHKLILTSHQLLSEEFNCDIKFLFASVTYIISISSGRIYRLVLMPGSLSFVICQWLLLYICAKFHVHNVIVISKIS